MQYIFYQYCPDLDMTVSAETAEEAHRKMVDLLDEAINQDKKDIYGVTSIRTANHVVQVEDA